MVKFAYMLIAVKHAKKPPLNKFTIQRFCALTYLGYHLKKLG